MPEPNVEVSLRPSDNGEYLPWDDVTRLHQEAVDRFTAKHNLTITKAHSFQDIILETGANLPEDEIQNPNFDPDKALQLTNPHAKYLNKVLSEHVSALRPRAPEDARFANRAELYTKYKEAQRRFDEKFNALLSFQTSQNDNEAREAKNEMLNAQNAYETQDKADRDKRFEEGTASFVDSLLRGQEESATAQTFTESEVKPANQTQQEKQPDLPTKKYSEDEVKNYADMAALKNSTKKGFNEDVSIEEVNKDEEEAATADFEQFKKDIAAREAELANEKAKENTTSNIEKGVEREETNDQAVPQLSDIEPGSVLWDLVKFRGHLATFPPSPGVRREMIDLNKKISQEMSRKQLEKSAKELGNIKLEKPETLSINDLDNMLEKQKTEEAWDNLDKESQKLKEFIETNPTAFEEELTRNCTLLMKSSKAYPGNVEAYINRPISKEQNGGYPPPRIPSDNVPTAVYNSYMSRISQNLDSIERALFENENLEPVRRLTLVNYLQKEKALLKLCKSKTEPERLSDADFNKEFDKLDQDIESIQKQIKQN